LPRCRCEERERKRKGGASRTLPLALFPLSVTFSIGTIEEAARKKNKKNERKKEEKGETSRSVGDTTAAK